MGAHAFLAGAPRSLRAPSLPQSNRRAGGTVGPFPAQKPHETPAGGTEASATAHRTGARCPRIGRLSARRRRAGADKGSARRLRSSSCRLSRTGKSHCSTTPGRPAAAAWLSPRGRGKGPRPRDQRFRLRRFCRAARPASAITAGRLVGLGNEARDTKPDADVLAGRGDLERDRRREVAGAEAPAPAPDAPERAAHDLLVPLPLVLARQEECWRPRCP